MATKGWAVKYRHGVISNRVGFTRKAIIEAEVKVWCPMRVKDWESRTVSWRWNWLKRNIGLRAVRVLVVEARP